MVTLRLEFVLAGLVLLRWEMFTVLNGVVRDDWLLIG